MGTCDLKGCNKPVKPGRRFCGVKCARDWNRQNFTLKTPPRTKHKLGPAD